MYIEGYKAFDANNKNRYGIQFDEGTIYSINGDIKFGNYGNGFHMCKNLEDTLRYFDGMNNDISIAKVIGFGDSATYNDEYYGYYDMYSVRNLKLEKFLSREEIINYVIKLNEYRIDRFLQGYKLNDSEIDLFIKLFYSSKIIMNTISYYQYGITDVYEKKYVKR